MLCSCYGDGEAEAPGSVLRSDWVRARLDYALAVERRRFVVVSSPQAEDASVCCYADGGRRSPLCRVRLEHVVITGDDGRRCRVWRRDGARPALCFALRFETLGAKLDWWRAARRAAREAAVRRGAPPRPRTGLESPVAANLDLKAALRACREGGARGDGEEAKDEPEPLPAPDDEPPTPRRPSEAPPETERTVVWRAHGMCVCEDARGETSVEPTYVHVARVAYGRLLKAFIRPPRADYDLAQLGPRTFVFRGHTYHRRDREATNERGRAVRYSVWRRAARRAAPRRSGVAGSAGDADRVVTVVYAHGNASSRVEGLSQLALCLDLGCQFIALDCCGSGQSDGEYVSLGFKEQDDVAAVLAAERAAPGGVGDVVLWGRSMGAVTALLVASTREPDVKALVLDSAFASLRSLSLDVVRRGANGVPRVLAEAALRWIRGSVRERADFDIFDVDALRHAPECEAAAFFICAADDGFVEPSHSARLHDAVASSAKEMCVCPGAHNTTRPRQCYARVELFLRRVLFGEEPADDARTLADDLDATLLPLISEPRRADRPNFAALAPWTVENLVIRAKQRLGQDDDDDGDDDPRPTSAPRWLADAAEPAHDDTVAAMQEETARVAKLL